MSSVHAAAPLVFMTAAASSFVSPLAVSGNVAAGDASRGGALYAARCGACHSLDDNGAGPRHAGLLGRRAGTQPGYEYSAAHARSGIIWSTATLNRWLADPRDRADLIAYLEQATR